MDKTQILIFALTLVFVAFRLYQKYIKKNKPDVGGDVNKPTNSGFSSSSKDDDYEPYSKK